MSDLLLEQALIELSRMQRAGFDYKPNGGNDGPQTARTLRATEAGPGDVHPGDTRRKD